MCPLLATGWPGWRSVSQCCGWWPIRKQLGSGPSCSYVVAVAQLPLRRVYLENSSALHQSQNQPNSPRCANSLRGDHFGRLLRCQADLRLEFVGRSCRPDACRNSRMVKGWLEGSEGNLKGTVLPDLPSREPSDFFIEQKAGMTLELSPIMTATWLKPPVSPRRDLPNASKCRIALEGRTPPGASCNRCEFPAACISDTSATAVTSGE